MRQRWLVLVAALAVTSGCTGKRVRVSAEAGIEAAEAEAAAQRPVGQESSGSPFMRQRLVQAVMYARWENGLPVGNTTVFCEDSADRMYLFALSEGGFATQRIVSPIAENGALLEPAFNYCRVLKPDGEIAELKTPNLYPRDDGEGWRIELKLVNAPVLPPANVEESSGKLNSSWRGGAPSGRETPAKGRDWPEAITLVNNKADPPTAPSLGRAVDETVKLYWFNTYAGADKYHYPGCRYIVQETAKTCDLPSCAAARRIPCRTCRPPGPEEVSR